MHSFLGQGAAGAAAQGGRGGHWHISTSMDRLVPLILLTAHTHVAVDDAEHELGVLRPVVQAARLLPGVQERLEDPDKHDDTRELLQGLKGNTSPVF
jgi:hypothetical protein